MIERRPESSSTSHTQPDPKSETQALVICALKASNEPNHFSMAVISGPVGAFCGLGERAEK